ncbi:autotransporter-associated beta strand repeat protein [Campylobacter sp. FOBRC14]|nr:autotransporter-associated beta strand repeat protein [Campylobacter sp. FOBRC14]
MMQESFTRAMLPYSRPDAEKYWINVTGQTGDVGYPNDKNQYINDDKPFADIQEFNQAGHSKWWTIAAPSESIYAANVDVVHPDNYGNSIYESGGGTSSAAPHVSGALGIIFQRYPYLSVSQARDVMLTTARQYTLRPGLEGKPLERWGSQGAGVPSEVWGWGILDLGKAMFGPGQFLGKFDVTMNIDDIWSNNISDTAIKFRKTEDDNDAATWAARKAVLESKANLSAEEKAELTMEAAREKARALRAAEGYEGSLVKRGLDTLTLVGDNSFTGTTTIYGGKISALNQSLKNSKIIVENGGALEILKSRTYYTPSSNGWYENTKDSTTDVVKATINSGGAFLLSRPGSSNVDITFNKGSLVGISPSADDLVEMMNSSLVKKGYSAQGVFNGYENANFAQEYAFFDLTKEEFSASKLKISVKKNDKTMIDFVSSANQNRIAKFIGDSAVLPASNAGAGFRSAATSRLKTSDLYRNLLIATPQQARDTFKTLANDANFAAQNTSVLNAILLRNIISNHKANLAATNVDQKESGLNFWTATMAHNFKYDSTDIKSRTFAQVFGADGALSDRTRLGGVLALTRTTTKSDGQKDYKTLNSSFGVYSQTDLGDFRINAGATYTKGNRHKESTSSIVQYVSNGNVKNKEILATLYADIGYNGISVGDFSLTPYLGASYINAKTKSSQQQIGVYTMSTSKDSRDIGIATIGINPSYAFGIFNANANIAYNRLFGQKAPSTTVSLGSNGSIDLEGEELKDLTTVDAGVEANIFKNAYLRLSYVGAFGSDVKSNGINAKFSWSF